MKVFVVVEFADIEYEECKEVMGVFTSEVKAKEAIAEYEKWSKNSRWHHEYNYFEYELDER